MGIFTKEKSTSENIIYTKSSKTIIEKSKIIELNMSTKEEGSVDEREEGEIIDEFEDIISSDEEFSMRKRIEELEAKNAELEKIANISVSAVYASGGYNDYPKKDSHHLDRYPLVSIDISDDEEYPPAPKMPRISKRRKSMQHSSSRHKLLHTSSSSHRRRKRSSSPPPAPQYRQADKLLLSLFHERVASHNSHSSKRKRKNKKTHTTKSSRRKSREYYVSDTEDDYNNIESYNVDVDNNQEHFNSSDCDKTYSLNRDELRVALARNTHRIEQHASLKDRLTRKKENTDMFNFVPSVDDFPPQKTLVVEEKEQIEKPNSPVEEKAAESDDNNLEEQELRILALKSAVLKKHMVRKKRNENVAYSPSDFDEIYKCISESPSLNNIDEQEACNSMEISPVPSPKMILSDDGGGIDTKPVDMDIVNSDSECELPSYDRWIPIEQIPLPNSIGINEELYNPTPIRYNNEETHAMPPDVRYESVSVSPKNFDSEVDEEELALRALLLAKMNSPKVNKIVKKQPPKVVQVQTPDADVSLEAEALRNFLINNMKKKARPKNSSASVLKEAVRRLTGQNASPSPTDVPIQSSYHVKTPDETEKELTQAISDMAKVNIGVESISEISKNVSTSCGIRVRNIETLRAPQNIEVNLDVQKSNSVYPKIVINQEKDNSKEIPMVQKNSTNESEKIQSIKKETHSGIQMTSNNVLKSVSSQKNKPTNVPKTFGRHLTVRIEKMILPYSSSNQNDAVKPNSGEEIPNENVSTKEDRIETVQIKAEIISGNLPGQRSILDVNEKNNEADITIEDVNSKICVKTEQETDQVNQSTSNNSNSEKELALKTAVNEKNVDPQNVEDQVSIIQILDPKESLENLKENVPKVSSVQNRNQETLPMVDETMNEFVEDADPTQMEAIEIKREDEQGSYVDTNKQPTDIKSDVVVEKEYPSTNLKEVLESTSDEIISIENKLTIIVDPEVVEEDVFKNSTNSTSSKEVILESISEQNVNRENISKTSPEKLLSGVDLPIGTTTTETVFSQVLLPRAESDQKHTKSDTNKILECISTIIVQENKFEAIKDKTIIKNSDVESDHVMMLAKSETLIDFNSCTTSKSGAVHIQHEKEDSAVPNTTVFESTSKTIESSKTFLPAKKEDSARPQEKPTASDSTSKPIESPKTVLPAKTRQVKLGTKSIEIQIQQKKKDEENQVSKLPYTQKVTEKPMATVEKLSTPKKILPSTTNVVTQKPIAKIQLPNQQPITTRTKIVKPNKIINQQTTDLKRKTVDNLLQLPVAVKKPRIDDTNRLITSVEIPKVPELIIQLRVSESESEYSVLSDHDNMNEDEDSHVRNFFNRSITIGNDYYDIASPISLPMESPCDTPTRSGSPIVSRTQTPQPSVEKSIVNDYFEAKLEQFLKNVRSKVSDNIIKPIEGQEIAIVNSTPVAVRHLPEASQQEYRRLINRMKMLERQKQAKNLKEHVKTSDSGLSDVRTTITDGDSKFLVRKVLIKNTTAKPSSSVIEKLKSPVKIEKMIENPLNPLNSVKSPQKPTSPESQDGNAVKSSKKLILYENSYRKTGTSIIANLDKSIEMVMVAKKAKMEKLKYEQRLRELRKEMEDVQKNLKEQQEKITKIYPEICNSHRAIESLKTRRIKINKAVTDLGKSVIGPNYSMQNDQKSIISEKSKKLAAEIKFVNNMKLSDVEIMEEQNRLNLPDNAKKIVAPAQKLISSIDEKLPNKICSSVDPPEKLKTSLEIQTPANSLLDEQPTAHKNDMPPMPASSSSSSLSPSSSSSAIIENEVPTCDSQSSEILNKPVPEEVMENHVNNTIVPEIFSNNNDDEKSCSSTNGHEEALELEQPVAVGDNINNNIEQAPDQTNMDENNEEEENGGEQVGSAKLQDYVSPLSHLRDERHINPNGVVCPYQLMGQCDDKDCKYMHLED